MRSILILSLLALAPLVAADSHETKTYVYATYSNCDLIGEEAADATFEKHMQPAYEASMEAGDIKGWGYMKHHTGGPWRRLAYHMGDSVSAVLSAGNKMNAELDKKLNARNDDFSRACHTHDDYIWQSQAGNAADTAGKVGLSVYMVCDMSREERADELVKAEFGPAYDAQIGPGKLTSWGWLTHVMGGEYRRLLTVTAENVDDLFKARSALLSGFQGSSAGREFTSICHSHQDVLWNIAGFGR